MPLLLDRYATGSDRAPDSAVLVRTLPESYRNEVANSFHSAVDAAGERIDHGFEIAGNRLSVQFAGSTLVPTLTSAIAHRAARFDTPDLVVHVWDEGSTRIAPPLPPCPGRSTLPAATHPDLFILFDEHAGEAFLWVRDAGTMPVYEMGAPFRTLLHWWMRARGLHFVHSAAVGFPEGGVILGGPSGSGKSTSALACLNTELGYAGDDYVLVGVDPTPTVHSLYRSAKLHAHHTARLPHLRPLIRNEETAAAEKALLFLDEEYASCVTNEFPLRAIVLPRVANTLNTRLVPAHPAQALRAIAPSTMLQLADPRPETLQALAELTRRLPCYGLELGTDLAQIPRVIKELLQAA